MVWCWLLGYKSYTWPAGHRILARLVAHRWLRLEPWKMRSKRSAILQGVRATRSRSPLPWSGRSGNSRLIPIPNLLMPDGWRHLKSKKMQLLHAKGYPARSDLFWRLHFSATIRYRGVDFYLGSIIMNYKHKLQMSAVASTMSFPWVEGTRLFSYLSLILSREGFENAIDFLASE
jgi:hypothetical protein